MGERHARMREVALDICERGRGEKRDGEVTSTQRLQESESSEVGDETRGLEDYL